MNVEISVLSLSLIPSAINNCIISFTILFENQYILSIFIYPLDKSFHCYLLKNLNPLKKLPSMKETNFKMFNFERLKC